MSAWLLVILLWESRPEIKQCPDTATCLADWNRRMADALEEGDVTGAGSIARGMPATESLDAGHAERIRAEGNLGALQLLRDDAAGAIRHFERAWASPGASRLPDAPVMRSNWALALIAIGRVAEGRAQLEQVLRDVERAGAPPEKMAIALANAAFAAAVAKDRQANTLYQRAIGYAEAHLGRDHALTEKLRRSAPSRFTSRARVR